MTAMFELQSSELRLAAATAAESAASTASGLARLRAEAEQVLSARWHGAAAAHFDRAWLDWERGARELLAGLERMAELLAQTERTYLAADASGAAGFFPGGSR